MKVLLLENIHPLAVENLERAGYDVELRSAAMSEDELVAGLGGVAMLGIRSNTHITQRVLDNAPDLQAIVAKGAMPPLVMRVDDCRATCDALRARGVEITQEPVERYGTVDAGFRDPSGNGWKLIQSRG